MKKVLLLLIILFLSGCVPKVTVRELSSENSKYLGKEVVVSGTVFLPMDVGGSSSFSLRQNGSSIMVSSDLLPEEDSEVVVRGILVKGIFTGPFIYSQDVRAVKSGVQ